MVKAHHGSYQPLTRVVAARHASAAGAGTSLSRCKVKGFAARGKHYIDINRKLETTPGSIRLATPGGKLISHDGLHLTKAGAAYVASIMRDEIQEAVAK